MFVIYIELKLHFIYRHVDIPYILVVVVVVVVVVIVFIYTQRLI